VNKTQRKVKVGVVGCGVVATAYYFPYLMNMPDVELVAVCDLEPVVGIRFGLHVTEIMWGALESSRTGQRYTMTTQLPEVTYIPEVKLSGSRKDSL
jgi:hypothetical protein